ncbi:MAG: DUF4440 domain-containing protein [Planctomycetes bacterium]|nr:DUF4440 domain-containing protein [Planctomycetota bacterium]
MGAHGADEDQSAVRQVVKRLNLAWQHGHFQDLTDCFHPRCTISIPWSGLRCEGRERCVQSYVDFTAAADITRYAESEPIVDVIGDTAVAVFEWDMEWTVTSGPQRETGFDVWVFTREAGKWCAVWRTQVSRSPAAT